MELMRIASFSDNGVGGNPAGVYIAEQHPAAAEMQAIAAEVGYSETAFAYPENDGWRVRYFAPEKEVPFCGHATIALGAALAMKYGAGVYPLQLNDAAITVEGFVSDSDYSSALQSPETYSNDVDASVLTEALALFGYSESDLDIKIPPAMVNAGANFLAIGLNSRSALSAMDYNLEAGRAFMNKAEIITVMFVYAEHSRVVVFLKTQLPVLHQRLLPAT